MRGRRFVIAGLLWIAATGVTAAHHSFAAIYDATRPLRIVGTVRDFEWRNPHARLRVESPDADGRVVSWTFEMGSVNVLTRFGWSPTTLRAGDRVTVEGMEARDGGLQAAAQFVTTADGVRRSSLLPIR